MKRLILILVSIMMVLCACNTSESNESTQIEDSSESVESSIVSDESVSDSESTEDETSTYWYRDQDVSFYELDPDIDSNDLPNMLYGGGVGGGQVPFELSEYLADIREVLDIRRGNDGKDYSETTYSGSYCGFEFKDAEFRRIIIGDGGYRLIEYAQRFREVITKTFIYINAETGLPCKLIDSPPKLGEELSEDELIEIAKKFVSDYSVAKPDISEYVCYAEEVYYDFIEGGETIWIITLEKLNDNGICLDRMELKMNPDGGITEFEDSYRDDVVTAVPNYNADDYIQASIEKTYEIFDEIYNDFDIVKVHEFCLRATPYVEKPLYDDFCAIRVDINFTVEFKENLFGIPALEKAVFYFPFDPDDYE